MSTTRMKIENIPLSDNKGGQAETHGLEWVHSQVFEHIGDGWVRNEWPNRHLAGSVLRWHRKRRASGERHQYDIVSLDTAARQDKKIQSYLETELGQIAGKTRPDGEPIPGEIDDLEQARIMLFGWLDLEPEEKADIRAMFGDMGGRRARAVNPIKKSIARRANRASELLSPSPMLATSLAIARELGTQHGEIVDDLEVAYARKIALAVWTFNENRVLASAEAKLATLGESPDRYLQADLGENAKQLRFKVQPFNHLAYLLVKSRKQKQDPNPALFAAAREGLHFQRYAPYLSEPFIRLSRSDYSETSSGWRRAAQTILPAVIERSEALEAMELGKDYAGLIGRVLVAASKVEYGLHHRSLESAQNAAGEVGLLLRYFCLPNDSDEVKWPWYRYQLKP